MSHMINVPHHSEPVPEWELERDEALFTAHGYWCEIKRHPDLGTLNGYVYMGAHHPYANQEYPDVSVHGGVTYNDGKKMGFDCSHGGDLIPFARLQSVRMVHSNPFRETYRNWAYVKEQVENLAAQLRAVDPMEVPDGILPAM